MWLAQTTATCKHQDGDTQSKKDGVLDKLEQLSYSKKKKALHTGIAKWDGTGHLFFTIPHPCLFLPPLTKQYGVPSCSV